MAATLWVGGPAMPTQAQAYGEWQAAQNAAAPAAPAPAGSGEDAMQPIYQGTQQVVTFFGRELDSALGQMVALVQNLARNKLSASDKYALSWTAKERYPVAITPLTQTVGFTKDEIQYLTKHGTWITVREAGKERVILGAVHSPGSNAIVSVAVPLAKFASALDAFRVGRDGRTFLIDTAGNVLNNPGRRFGVDRDALLKMLGDDLGTLETRSSIISFSKIPSADWYVLLETPKADARDGLVFPSDQQLRMSLALEAPVEVVKIRDWLQVGMPALAVLLFLGLG
ncbi:MAG: hypothetical protein FJZ00_11025, partial [Candidatus Sericytochromatia bacterium]|nr:hypothetical protein [Candidatus Tanganyikabacteria bacterium]